MRAWGNVMASTAGGYVFASGVHTRSIPLFLLGALVFVGCVIFSAAIDRDLELKKGGYL